MIFSTVVLHCSAYEHYIPELSNYWRLCYVQYSIHLSCSKWCKEHLTTVLYIKIKSCLVAGDDPGPLLCDRLVPLPPGNHEGPQAWGWIWCLDSIIIVCFRQVLLHGAHRSWSRDDNQFRPEGEIGHHPSLSNPQALMFGGFWPFMADGCCLGQYEMPEDADFKPVSLCRPSHWQVGGSYWLLQCRADQVAVHSPQFVNLNDYIPSPKSILDFHPWNCMLLC